MSPSSRLCKFFILLSIGVLAMSGLAHADNIQNDITVSPKAESFAAGGSVEVGYKIQPLPGGAPGNGQTCDPAFDNITLTVVVPAGVTVTPASRTFATCDELKYFEFSSNTVGTYEISVVPSDFSTGSYNANPAKWTLTVTAPQVADADSDGIPDTTDNCKFVANANQANADGDLLGDACDSNSYAPAVGTQAGNADGFEGSPGNPSTSGSFTDQDGNGTLSLSLGAGNPGTLTPDGSGGFSWSHTTTDDDAGGTITVTASDGEHTSASQSFTWSASNVDPVLGTVTTSATGPCSMSLEAPFSDQGSADIHDSSIDWGDGSATSDTDPDTTPVTGSHTYAGNGTYTASVTVNDDDGGTDTDSAVSFATKNSASAIMQPINTTGTRSSFKIGQTIPVKITVTGCDGAAVTTLTPTVTLYKLDGTPNPGDVESPAAAVATNGLAMRWSETHYIYNLSTKLSQQYGTALTAGSYRVAVDDPSFYSRTTADFELRK